MSKPSFRPDPAYARTIGADIDTPRYVVAIGTLALCGAFLYCAITAVLMAVWK